MIRNKKLLPGYVLVMVCSLCLLCSTLLPAQPRAWQPPAGQNKELNRLLDRSNAQLDLSPDSARIYMQQATRLAKKAKRPNALAEAYTLAGIIQFKSYQYDSAVHYYQQALELYRQTGNEPKMGHLYERMAFVELMRGQPEKALQLLLSALALHEKRHDSLAIGKGYKTIAHFYENQEQYEMALSYLTLARQMLSKHGSEEERIALASSFGTIYYRLGRYREAEANLEKAIDYYRERGNLRNLASAYVGLASVKMDMKQVDQAIDLQKSALALQVKRNDKAGQVGTLNNMGLAHLQTGNYDKALPYLNQALSIAAEIKNTMMERDVLGNLYYSHKQKGDTAKALKYLELYSDLQDSLFTTTRSQQIAELQEKYEARQREKEIALLKKDQELKETRVSRRTLERNITIAGLLLTIIISIAVVRTIRSRQRSAMLLAAKNEELNHQRVNDLLKEQELISVHSMLQGQETERKRIAQDLHDRLGSLLATVKLHFQMASTPEQHQYASQLIDEACQEVRQISHNMVSGVLMKFGLVAALHDLAHAVSKSGKIKMVAYSHGIDNRLPNQIEIELYRVVQELLSNTLRHANATEITVQLTRLDTDLNLLVEDNGRGFDPNNNKSQAGLGMQGIRSRVHQLHGELHIDSGRGNGTTVMVDVPLPPAHPSYTFLDSISDKKPSYDQAVIS